MIVIITGMLASGKSTLADNLGKHLNFEVYKKDTYKEHLVDLYDFKTREENRVLSIKAVNQMIDDAEKQIIKGINVVLEANFRKDEIGKIFNLGKKYHTPVKLLGLCGDQNVLYKRFLSRVPTRHKAHMSMHLDKDFEAYKKYNEGLMNEILDFHHVQIDVTTLNIDDLFNKVAKILIKEI